MLNLSLLATRWPTAITLVPIVFVIGLRLKAKFLTQPICKKYALIIVLLNIILLILKSHKLCVSEIELELA